MRLRFLAMVRASLNLVKKLIPYSRPVSALKYSERMIGRLSTRTSFFQSFAMIRGPQRSPTLFLPLPAPWNGPSWGPRLRPTGKKVPRTDR